MQTWVARVAAYIDQLDALIEQLDTLLAQIQVDETKREAALVQASADQLRSRLQELEQQVAERDRLLKADDAPATGSTLVQKLHAANERVLAERCRGVADLIVDLHQRSIAIFVCQFHLSNLTTDLVRLMTGADRPATYGLTESVPPTPQGGLFNEAV